MQTQRYMHSYTQKPYKNTKQESIIYMQMTCKEEKNKNQSPDKALQDKEPQNVPLSSFCVGHRRLCQGKLIFVSVYQPLSQECGLVSLSPRSVTAPSDPDLCRPFARCCSLCKCVYASVLIYLEDLVPCSPSCLALKLFPHPLLQNSLSLEGTELKETSYL